MLGGRPTTLRRCGGPRNKLLWKPHAPASNTPTACVRGGAAVKLGKRSMVVDAVTKVKA